MLIPLHYYWYAATHSPFPARIELKRPKQSLMFRKYCPTISKSWLAVNDCQRHKLLCSVDLDTINNGSFVRLYHHFTDAGCPQDAYLFISFGLWAYCNLLLFGINDELLPKLKSFENAVALRQFPTARQHGDDSHHASVKRATLGACSTQD